MHRFFVEVSQHPDAFARKQIKDSVQILGSHFATHAHWSRNDGICTGSMIVEAHHKSAALRVVPPNMRSDAHVFELEPARRAVYDKDSGQLVTGSFMDYGMPHAEIMLRELREARHPVPATTNPLGVKGTGEAGTTASIAAVMNAVTHAIPNGAADHMDMPATPAKVWEACRRAIG